MTNAVQRRSAVLVDQYPMWMETVRHVLIGASIEVVDKVPSSTAALASLEALKPDLVITELLMPEHDLDGVTFVQMARERLPDVRLIVFSMIEDAGRVQAALAAGADAYVLKTAHPDDLTSAVRQAFHHSIFLAGLPGPTTAPAPAPAPTAALEDGPGLTRRELEILRLVAEGHSNADLAQMLWVTEQTVKFHLSNIYRKLDVSNRTEASRWAQLRGILPAPATSLRTVG
jgi:DNA-binding NarL/FixJ family response regulator